jgi:phage-related tail fiber protein
MANTIRIKRRSTDSTAPSTSQAVNGELAFNENNDILYYGKGGNSSASSSVIKIGGSGAYLTTDTNQTPTGVKTFSTTTFKLTGGSNGQVVTTDGSGNLAFSSVSANAFSTVAGNTGSTTAVGADTLTITGSGAVSVAVTSPSGVDTATITVASASTSVVGVVQLTDSTSSTSTTTAATPNSVKSAYDLANAALARSGGTMTGAITLAADPTNALHAATKQYVDATATGLDVKASVRAATVGSNITLSGTQTIDGVALVAGNRVLVKDQSTTSQNGIYVVAAGAWSRATDADVDAEVHAGMFTFVTEGTVNADSGWVLTTNDPITVGTTGLSFSQFSGAGQITAGAGLTKNGNTIDVATADAGRIVVNADSIDLATVTQTDTSGTAGINFVQSITKDSYGRISGRVLADVRTGSTTQTGILQLTDATNSTSTTTAATPNSVKTAFDLANAALARSGGTMTGKITTVASSTSTASILLGVGAADPSAPASGDFWNNTGVIKFYNGSATKTLAFTDSNITGTAANVTGTVAAANGGTGITSYAVGDLVYASGTTTLAKLAAVATGNVLISGGVTTAPSWGKVGLTTHVDGTLAVANGGTGAATFTSKGIIYGNGTSALQVTAAGAWDATNGTGSILSVDSNNTPVWTNTVDGGGY